GLVFLLKERRSEAPAGPASGQDAAGDAGEAAAELVASR
ncbi:MAG: hypothetical protein JWN19_1359, partial [Arthrobacter sp.]|nr:hypothetical protein [Arthrobacter sp.]